ncbi:MAG: hypothetical protein AB7W16_21100 [Candidatus Obscuribacterales bacterium]
MSTFLFAIGLVASIVTGAWSGKYLARILRSVPKAFPLLGLIVIVGLYALRDHSGYFGCLCAFISASSCAAFWSRDEANSASVSPSAGHQGFPSLRPTDDPFARRNPQQDGSKTPGVRFASNGARLRLASDSGKSTGSRPKGHLKTVR